MKKISWIILSALVLVFSCSKDEDEEPTGRDPLIGTWNMVAVEQNGQEVDVTNQPCLRDSRLDVNEGTMTLTLSAPLEEGSTDCETESASAAWENDNGSYYVIENGDRHPANFALIENNQRLSLDLDVGGSPLTLIFRK